MTSTGSDRGSFPVIRRSFQQLHSGTTFYQRYYLQHRAVLVSNCFCDESPLSYMKSLTSTSILRHPEVADVAVEVSRQRPGDVMNAEDDPDIPEGLLAPDAEYFLHDDAESSATKAARPFARYVKLSLTESPSLAASVARFLQPSQDQPLVPADHPMLLSPGKYFCWAFLGDKGSGSKTHVDVMGSDAWLVVISGRKRWALCHPADKHLVMNAQSGAFANLFDIDPVQFPFAHQARISYFFQEAGEAIFVPSDAPHTVENETATTSITFNFMRRGESQWVWQQMMTRVVDEATSHGICDLVLMLDDSRNEEANTGRSHPKQPQTARRMTIRLFLPGKLWESTIGGSFKCLSDFSCRVYLEAIHEALAQQHGTRFRVDLRTVGVPVGFYEQTRGDRRVLIYFLVDSESFSDLVERAAIVEQADDGETDDVLSTSYLVKFDNVSADKGEAQTTIATMLTPFPSFSSHIGSLPDFPPVSVILQQSWYFELSWTLKPLALVLQSRRTAQSTSSSHVVSGSAEALNVGRMSLWHYSRFPWMETTDDNNELTTRPALSPWNCATYLFYSSPFTAGPVALYPLVDDATLQSADGLQGARQRQVIPKPDVSTSPHFEEFVWNVEGLLRPAGDDNVMLAVMELGEDLVAELLTKLLLPPPGQCFLSFCSRHAPLASVASVDWSVCGIEKLAILALYFGTRPAVVGFTYSYRFRFVSEPGTLCLSGSAAHNVLRRQRNSPLANALTQLCHAIEFGSTSGYCSVEALTQLLISVVRSESESTTPTAIAEVAAWLLLAVQSKRDDLLQQLGATTHEGAKEEESAQVPSTEISSTIRSKLQCCDDLISVLTGAAQLPR